DDADASARQRLAQVLTTPSREVVEDDDVGGAGVEELVDDVRADQARAASNTDAAATGKIHAGPSIARMTFAGLPATIIPGATSFVTTLPAPMMAPSPISTPPRILAPAPTDAPLRLNLGTNSQ